MADRLQFAAQKHKELVKDTESEEESESEGETE
jgi:hypothetical protein